MMSAAKVFMFMPADPTPDTHEMLQEQGCELILGKASWDMPDGDARRRAAWWGGRATSGPTTAAPLRRSPCRS